ncbi:MAG: hypothetical protein MK316_13435 [Pseudomonadales bacterium]|nr:hypothetical protein [Pseudomonadales bacterium]
MAEPGNTQNDQIFGLMELGNRLDELIAIYTSVAFFGRRWQFEKYARTRGTLDGF